MLAVALVAFTACTNEESLLENITNEPEGETTEDVLFEVGKFISAHDTQSRTVVTTNENEATISWAEGDTIAIVPAKGAQIYFVIDNIDPENSNKALFTGGAWKLKNENSYASYYRFIPDYSISSNRVPVDYTVQSYKPGANGTINPSHDYMVARSVKQDQGNLKFSFTHLGALVEMKFALPKTALVKEFRLRANEDIFPLKGTFDLTADNIVITPDTDGWSNEIQVNVEGLETTAGNMVSVFFMMPPIDVENFNTSKLSASLVYGEYNDKFNLRITNDEYTQLKPNLYYTLNTQELVFKPTLAQWKEIISKSLSTGKTKVRFVPGSTETSELTYVANGVKAYIVTNDDWAEIHTPANEMYLPANSSGLFTNNTSLTEVDLSNLNTNEVTNMGSMFYGCHNLTQITFGDNFNSEKVTNMSYMFYLCDELTTLDLSKFNYGAVTNMQGMFCECRRLQTLNIDLASAGKIYQLWGSVETNKLVNASYMFKNCMNLTSLDLKTLTGHLFNNVEEMFSGCTKLATLDLSYFNFGYYISVDNNIEFKSAGMFLNLGSTADNPTIKVINNFNDNVYYPEYVEYWEELVSKTLLNTQKVKITYR